MLATIDPKLLDRLWFPLGDQTKADTRAQAAAAGLEVAGRADSQEACFLAGGDYRDFLQRRGLEAHEGAIVDEDGRELGRHDGFWRFTPGQRRGLGIAAAEPLYALRTDARRNTVVVGPRAALGTTTVRVKGRLYAPAATVQVKLRARSPLVSARLAEDGSGFTLHLAEAFHGAARGQTAVVYDGEAVVGAGTIDAVAA